MQHHNASNYLKLKNKGKLVFFLATLYTSQKQYWHFHIFKQTKVKKKRFTTFHSFLSQCHIFLYKYYLLQLDFIDIFSEVSEIYEVRE